MIEIDSHCDSASINSTVHKLKHFQSMWKLRMRAVASYFLSTLAGTCSDRLIRESRLTAMSSKIRDRSALDVSVVMRSCEAE